MAGLRINLDADLTRFTQLVKQIQKVRAELGKLSTASPSYDKLYKEFKRIKGELDEMKKKFAEIQTALAQVDIASSIVKQSETIRHETDETSKHFEDYADSLNAVKKQVAALQKEYYALEESERNSSVGQAKLKQWASLNAQLKVTADSMRDVAKVEENAIKVYKSAEGSLVQLRKQLSMLNFQYDNLSRDLRNGATGKELLIQIQAVTNELNSAEQATGRFQRSVGHYATAYNGLNAQVQMLARELPSLAVSMNTFFLAISNNFPMLIDEIQKARIELAKLRAEGKEGTPVWKQLTKSLLGWNTTLVVGLTLLSNYGTEIGDWIKQLFDSKEKLDLLKEALKSYNEAIIEGEKNAQGQIVELELLYKAATDAAEGTDTRAKAIKKLQDQYPDYFEGMNKEAFLAGKAKTAYDNLTQSILANAKARAAEGKLVENYSQIIDLEGKITSEYVKRDEAQIKLDEEIEKRNKINREAEPDLYAAQQIGVGIALSEVEKFDKIIAEYRREIYNLNKVNQDIKNGIKISDLLFPPDSDSDEDGGNGEKAYNDAYQRGKSLLKAEQNIKDAILKSQLDAQKIAIDIMEEGNAKELAQINANYDAKIAEIQKRERELLQTLQDAEYEAWKAANPDYKKKGLQFVPTIVDIPSEHRNNFDAEYSSAYQKQQNEINKLLQSTLNKYQDYNKQREQLVKSFNEEMEFLNSQRTEQNSEEIDRAIKVAKKKLKEGLKGIRDEMEKEFVGQENTFLKMLYGDISQMGFSGLSNLISQARQLNDYLSGKGDKEGITFISKEQLEAIEKSPADLEKLRKALDKLLGTGKKENKWEEIFETFKKGFASLKNAKDFKEKSGAIDTISNAASSAAGEVANLFEAMGKTSAADAISGVEIAMNAISNIGQGFAKGGIVGGIASAVGEAANLIGKAFAANSRHKKALEAIMNETIDQQREYNLLLLEQNLLYEKASTIFGVDIYSKAKNAVINMKDSVKSLNKELTDGEYGSWITNIERKFLKRANQYIGSALALKDQYAGLANVEIKTGHKKTGLFGWGKGKDVYSSVLDVYPQLIKANGEFDKSLAETIINTRTMSDESKAALQYMIDLAQQAEDAYSELNDYMTDIFGDLGNSMTDALVNAFVSGTDAARAFTESVSSMLETLSKQMIYSVTLAPVMEQAQSKMLDVMKNTDLSDEQRFNQWTTILDNLVDDALAQQSKAEKLMEEYQKIAANKGFDILSNSSSSSQEASKKGFATASQDSIDELNGRFTALQIAGEEIKNQSVEQTRLLDSINSILLNIEPSQDSFSIPDLSLNREALNSSFAADIAMRAESNAQLQAAIVNLTGEVQTIKNNVSEMLTFSAEDRIDQQTIAENSSNLNKNLPKITQALDGIKQNTNGLSRR
ncbi:hypothetical protein [Bacteroides caccae]|uniref:Phage tail tape measure protein n=1 Tax=Bacteroides caccae TaxID=47678 RepID=A0A6A1K3Z8_9BACE|nr:hypothetical protein [Bacteroides caccae]KAA5476878.1 hypothetical protein F2Y27_18410 [Bacteroides caccae]KAA5484710.1 hypothetical protein F2Y25_20370 [Bacteroides caccae]KAA5488214.1 hypothetical protein F2Y35_18625 [Bacteroides caccae]KAA5499574.1 hypothetical protein F2Y47_18895 [Bacteroides caccae]